MTDIAKALNQLAPNCNFGVGNESLDEITWAEDNPLPQPSREDIIAKQAELVIEAKANEYKEKRFYKYPSVGDQLDMIYKDNKNSTTTHADAVEAVKAQFPKP